MESDSNNRKLYEVKLGSSPTESNLAVVSIDIHGSPGELNRYVLKSFGYDDSAPKELELNSGYALLQHESLNPILFIVTVGEDRSIVNLPKNLTNGLRVYKELFYGKTIWIPLMGMGAGELDITASFDITTDVLDTLFPEGAAEGLQFIISLPPTADGERLFGQINSSLKVIPIRQPSEQKPTAIRIYWKITMLEFIEYLGNEINNPMQVKDFLNINMALSIRI